MLVAAYVGVSAALGLTLLTAPPEPEAAGAGPVTSYIYPPVTPSRPSTSDSPAPGVGPTMVAWPVPPGYQRVGGPGGLVTAVPQGWVFTRASGPGAMQATDPGDPGRYVRYGGSPPPDGVSLNDSHVDYARRFAASRPGFTSIRLDAVTYRGMPAVEWEFEHDADTGRRHVKSLYWRVNGIEYFIYTSSTSDKWPDSEPIYRVMTANTTP